MIGLDTVRRQAEEIARANREADPAIKEVYWFPHEEEVRLIEADETVPRSWDGKVHPFRFRASLEDDLPAPSDVALIRPEEVGKVELPEGWGSWDDAEKV